MSLWVFMLFFLSVFKTSSYQWAVLKFVEFMTLFLLMWRRRSFSWIFKTEIIILISSTCCLLQMTSLSRNPARPLPSAPARPPGSTDHASALTLRPLPWRCRSWAAHCLALCRAAHQCWRRARAATPWTSLRCVPVSSPHWHAETYT